MSADVQFESVPLHLPASPTAAAEARAYLSAWCTAAGAAEACDVAELLVTELVANAVRHAGTDVTVTLARLAASVRIEVADRSRQLPQRRAAGLLDEGGRGLLLVDLLAESWGVEVGQAGKSVWACVPLSGPPERPAQHSRREHSRLLGAHHRTDERH